MEKKQLGKSGFDISPIGLGTWAIAGPNWAFGWGPQNDDDSLAALRAGIEGGVNWIDTAPIYGHGHAESLVGKLLSDYTDNDRPLLFTKCSVLFDEEGNVSHSLEGKSIVQEVEASLTRMGTDVIDLLQIHWPAFPPGGPDDGIEEAIQTMADLKSAGKIRGIGVSNFDVSQLARATKITQVDSIQPPFSLLMRGAANELLGFAENNGIGAITYSTLQSGLLSGRMTHERVANLPEDDWRKTMSPEFKEPNLSRNLELVEVLRAIGDRHGQSPAIVAIAWVLSHSSVTGAIVGARNAQQATELLPAIDFRLSEDELSEISSSIPEGTGSDLAFAAE